MHQRPTTHRWGAALLSAVLLAGIFLPVLRHACASSDVAGSSHASPSTAPIHATPGHQGGHDALDASSTHHGSDAGEHAAHDCMDPCLGDCACAVQTAPVEVPDLRLPPRSLQEKGHVVLAIATPVSLPSPADPGDPQPVPTVASPPPLPVPLHVWTATFLK